MIYLIKTKFLWHSNESKIIVKVKKNILLAHQSIFLKTKKILLKYYIFYNCEN